MDQKKYEDAIAHLEEDQDNPFTMELLVQAYYQTVQTDKLHEVEAKLRGTNVPTMEQALVVPAARAKRPPSSRSDAASAVRPEAKSRLRSATEPGTPRPIHGLGVQ